MGTMIGALRWIARAASLVTIGVILLFFVGEGFDPSRVAWHEWIGLAFFPAAVVAGLIVAWRREGLGGGIAILGLLGFYGVYGLLNSGTWPSGWAYVLFASPGLLFLLCWFLSPRVPRVVA